MNAFITIILLKGYGIILGSVIKKNILLWNTLTLPLNMENIKHKYNITSWFNNIKLNFLKQK